MNQLAKNFLAISMTILCWMAPALAYAENEEASSNAPDEYKGDLRILFRLSPINLATGIFENKALDKKYSEPVYASKGGYSVEGQTYILYPPIPGFALLLDSADVMRFTAGGRYNFFYKNAEGGGAMNRTQNSMEGEAYNFTQVNEKSNLYFCLGTYLREQKHRLPGKDDFSVVIEGGYVLTRYHLIRGEETWGSIKIHDGHDLKPYSGLTIGVRVERLFQGDDSTVVYGLDMVGLSVEYIPGVSTKIVVEALGVYFGGT